MILIIPFLFSGEEGCVINIFCQFCIAYPNGDANIVRVYTKQYFHARSKCVSHTRNIIESVFLFCGGKECVWIEWTVL